jgi:3-phenylpropionate/cinnamic acid dioxygenase small subunit
MTEVQTQRVAPPKRARVRATNPLFLEIQEFLTDEAALLDHDQHLDWLDLLTDDVTYRMPLRETRNRFDGRGFSDSGSYYDDDRLSLGLRARRNTEFQYAYDRDPAPRVRRIVTNLTVEEGDTPEEHIARSYILLMKNRFDTPTYDLLSAEREDVIRSTPDGLRLAKREIFVDMQVLTTFTWVNVFL